MSTPTIFNDHFQHYITNIDDIFKDLHQLTQETGNQKLSGTVDDIRSRLNEPFLFVIVGEVKVGKSSFVNALLETDKEVAKVAPDPCTDTIQQIVYSETEAVIPINEHLKKITLPIEILKKIAIVDTPGTNAVIEHHQEITERFIPVSDLIVFVFEAKNPYRQSAWEFFDYISKEWRKKVIFVLQQKDLIDDDDLEVNRKGVIQYAQKRGVDDPRVFCVSAKTEQKGNKEESGFGEVREYIRETVTGGNNVRLKLQSIFNTSNNILENIQTGVAAREKQLNADQSFRGRVDSLMDNAQEKSNKQADDLVEDMLSEYDRITTDIGDEFENGLGVFTLLKKSVLSIFNKKESMEEWLESITQRIEKELKPSLESKLRDGIVNIAESIKQMAEIIDIEIRKNEAVLKTNNEVFGAIANKRQEKLEKLQANLSGFISETEDFINKDMLKKSSGLVPNMVTGGGLAIVGAVIASVTTGMAMDVTGGVLSVIGISVAGIVTAVQKRRIISEFDAEIAKGRTNLEEQVHEKLYAYIKEIRVKIDNNFLEFDSFVSGEKQGIESIQRQYADITDKFQKLRKELEV